MEQTINKEPWARDFIKYVLFIMAILGAAAPGFMAYGKLSANSEHKLEYQQAQEKFIPRTEMNLIQSNIMSCVTDLRTDIKELNTNINTFETSNELIKNRLTSIESRLGRIENHVSRQQ
jgi:hypothetical protein